MKASIEHVPFCEAHRMYWPQEGTDSPLYAKRCPLAWTLPDESCRMVHREMLLVNGGPFRDCVMEIPGR